MILTAIALLFATPVASAVAYRLLGDSFEGGRINPVLLFAGFMACLLTSTLVFGSVYLFLVAAGM